jgi:hypothetical protein
LASPATAVAATNPAPIPAADLRNWRRFMVMFSFFLSSGLWIFRPYTEKSSVTNRDFLNLAVIDRHQGCL